MEVLSSYVRKFSKLRVDRSKGESAPHKPILLLSVIWGIDAGYIKTNKIYITPDLVADFKILWSKLANSTKFTANFSLPFYHLKSDGFWYLKTLLGKEIVLTSSHSIKSFAQLKEIIDFASFEDELFDLLLNKPTRDILRHTLLNVYFPDKSFDMATNNEVIAEIVDQILNEPSAIYKTKAEHFDEEELFIRGGLFKRVVPLAYNYTCCVTKMRITANKDIQMIDACHIIPFSASHDDTISNGISLCPNLHRAFDRGLISIGQDYCVIVSNSFTEAQNSYSLKVYHGKQIMLPNDERLLPGFDNLKWHRQNVFREY